MPEDFAPDGLRPEAFDPDAEALVVAVQGFEGPLDLLLTLARGQKVDLLRISILELAEGYLGFVAEARRMRIELAADYLVMAAWLAFLKSRLLLPKPPADGGPSAEEMAARLAWRLQRLEAVRRAAARLMDQPQLGRDRFARGVTEGGKPVARTEWGATLPDLLKAYAGLRSRSAYQPLHMRRAPVLALEEAYARLREMLDLAHDWGALAAFLPPDWMGAPERRRSAVASTFAATLEMARRGAVEIRQDAPFAPLWLRPVRRA
jgi:segregation and condensation protein A